MGGTRTLTTCITSCSASLRHPPPRRPHRTLRSKSKSGSSPSAAALFTELRRGRGGQGADGGDASQLLHVAARRGVLPCWPAAARRRITHP